MKATSVTYINEACSIYVVHELTNSIIQLMYMVYAKIVERLLNHIVDK